MADRAIKKSIGKDLTGRQKALKIAGFTLEKKAKDIVILDLSRESSLWDYFIICSGESTRQVKAIYDEAARICKKSKIRIHHYEGGDEAHWILADFFDVVLHIFLDEKRKFYDLEYLWSAARKINFKPQQPAE